MLVLRALDLDVDQLCLRAFQLRLGLQHVGALRDAGLVLVAHQLQRLLVVGNGPLQQRLLGIGDAQQEIGLRQRGLRRQQRRGQVGLAGLRARFAALDLAPYAAPQIDLPAGRQRCRLSAGDIAVAAARAVHAGLRADHREVAGACRAQDRGGLAVLGLGGGDGLVGDLHARHQRVELRIAEHGPPVAALSGVAGLGGLPLAPFGRRLLEGGCHRRIGPLVVGPDRAGAEQQRAGHHDAAGQGGGAGHRFLVHRHESNPAGVGADGVPRPLSRRAWRRLRQACHFRRQRSSVR